MILLGIIVAFLLYIQRENRKERASIQRASGNLTREGYLGGTNKF